MVALQQRFRHIGLNGARKAAALHPPCAAAALQDALAQRKRHRQPLMPDIRGAVHILAQCKGGAPAFQHQRGKIGKAFFQQSPALGQRAGIFFVIVDGTQHRAVTAGGTQPGQCCPKIGFRHLTQHLAAQAGRHSLHLLPDGRDLPGQLAVAAPGVGHAQGHAGRQ